MKKLLVLLILPALAGVSLGATSPRASASTSPPGRVSGPSAALPSPQLIPLRFGSPQAVSDAGVFIGRDRGYFREYGLALEVLPQMLHEGGTLLFDEIEHEDPLAG